jgi:hypothetical protein
MSEPRQAQWAGQAPPIISQAARVGHRHTGKAWILGGGLALAMVAFAAGWIWWLRSPTSRQLTPERAAPPATAQAGPHQPRLAESPVVELLTDAGAAPPASWPVITDAPVLATRLLTVADDFIVDLFHNGEKVPDTRRRLEAEVFGATVERIELELREGDWLVFNVVNNRLRWGGVYYFAVAGFDPGNAISFVTELESGRWSVCDLPGQAPRFIAEQDYLTNNLARPVERRWTRGDELIRGRVPGWPGEPLWGTNRNTWIKFVARP